MGPLVLLILVCPCLRETVIVTCKIVPLFSFLEIKFQNGAHLKKKRLFLIYLKRAIFDLLFRFF